LKTAVRRQLSREASSCVRPDLLLKIFHHAGPWRFS
jgi:hypothetical protein